MGIMLEKHKMAKPQMTDEELLLRRKMTQDIIAESNLREHGVCNFWTKGLIAKYLRKYDLGPGPTAGGRAKHRYRKSDVRAAMEEVRAGEPPASSNSGRIFVAVPSKTAWASFASDSSWTPTGVGSGTVSAG